MSAPGLAPPPPAREREDVSRADAPAHARILDVRDLGVRFETRERVVEAVRNLSFHVDAGETLAIVGESGSGKSVSALAVMRLVEHGGGRIASGTLQFRRRSGVTLDLARADAATMRSIRGADIAMVFQEPMTSLNPVYTVGEQIAESVRLHQRLGYAAARAEALRMLELVRVPEARSMLGRHPHQLSGGMRQRVMIAMALSCKPVLLIADEPTTALDVTIQAQILAVIRALQDEMRMGVVFITHDMGVVAEMADRVLVMREGEKVEENDCAGLFAAPRHPYTRALLAAVPKLGAMRGQDAPRKFALPDSTATGDAQDATPDVARDTATDATPDRAPDTPQGFATEASAGAAMTAARAATAPVTATAPSMAQARTSHTPYTSHSSHTPRSTPVLRVQRLTTRFPLHEGVFGRVRRRVHAVEQVSFELAAGETLALVGESGCGKSTTGRSLARLVDFEAGSVEVAGRDVAPLRGRALQAMRRDIQFIFQDPYASLDPRLTVGFSIMEPLLVHRVAGRAAAEARVAALLRKVGLQADAAQRYPHEFSGGQRQRIAIARALTLHPKIVVADEAVSALDVSIRAQIVNLLLDLQAEFGIAFLFISHDMAVVERIAHRVAVMYLGQIVEIGPRRAVFESPQHPYTRKLMAAVPVADPARRHGRRELLAGEIPSPIRALGELPHVAPLQEVGTGHFVARHAVGGEY